MDQLFISRKVFVHGVHWLHETGGGKKVAAHYLHYVNETLINVQMTKKAWENQSACGYWMCGADCSKKIGILALLKRMLRFNHYL